MSPLSWDFTVTCRSGCSREPSARVFVWRRGWTYAFAGNWSANTHPSEIVAAFGNWTSANVLTGLNTSFSGPYASGALTLRSAPIPPQSGVDVAAGIPLSGVTKDSNGVIQSAVIFWTTDTTLLQSNEGYFITALHEIGHLLGLDDTNGKPGTSIMNGMLGKDDAGKNMPRSITKCDRDAAYQAQYRSYP